MSTYIKFITNKASLLSVKDFSLLRKHSELIAAMISGAIILFTWILHDFLSDWLFITLLLSSFVIGGYAKAREGITETVRDRKLNVELLMIIAAVGAASIGYWTEGAILIFIFALSGALETYTEENSQKELKALIKLQPESAHLLLPEGYRTVAVSKLAIGDKIFIKAGEKIPADGMILEGQTIVDESTITGESLPVTRSINEDVYAGTINLNGSIIVEITKLASETLFQKIIHLVQQAQSEKSPSQTFIEKFESTYVKTVLLVVTLMMFLPHFLFNWTWQDTIYRAMILLVVASPCALVASIMPATLSAISNGAKKGVLFKGGAHVEAIGNIKAIAFDKTGTLTYGKPAVTDVIFREDINQQDVIPIIHEIERQSNHPIADAITQWSTNQNTIHLSNVVHIDGKGIEAYHRDDYWQIGNSLLIGDHKAEDFLRNHSQSKDMFGKTLVYVAKNEAIIAMFALEDQLREEAIKAIKSLNQLGIQTVMLTGDNEETAKSITSQAGIKHYKANCLPSDKVAELERLSSAYENVAMIGDGVNDAPALATADIGIAMGTGSDVALETADIVLVKSDLPKIVEAIKVSHKMNRIIKQNIAFSILVILCLIASNFMQVIDLPLGVIGHEGSTILVILNGLRLLRS
ncbi:cadmium-translocating P-type ATPase [Gracilibacillus oryzae]|uniref:Cadmium-translocating P-type ATPase n=1 Tax=Gracilibacillus oryzae TaxID=1672701 RepID=A0A7C8KNV9_9BACI|nr:heavy metal translocating P-type ATPase [Gracilibacillus oryzae]KAB8129355.1 cadmium-translocating P-type ATPase [Gracilibacillus oryzae]